MLRTPRLLLRRWRPEDRVKFAALNSDPQVMRYMPGLLSRKQSDDWADLIEHEFERDGFGLWALEVPGVAPFIGFTGLDRVPFSAGFTPSVEIGWRLASGFWGQGYATEAAMASLKAGFERFDLDEIVANTFTGNTPSRLIMKKLGMIHDPVEDFDHPQIEESNIKRRYVLYRLQRSRWRSALADQQQ